MLEYFKILITLIKIRISLSVSLSTAVGYIISKHVLDNNLWISMLGVFLLSSGSSALNQVQEQHFDRKMNRTKHRPVPSFKITSEFALIIAIIFLLSGILVLLQKISFISLSLGLFSVFWYNAVYTNLKKVTPYALFVGAIIGAIPPAIGWCAAGSLILKIEIISLSLFFYMWQIPHFSLLLIRYGKEYEEAGFLTISKYVSELNIKHITFVWIVAVGIYSMLFWFINIISNFYIHFAIIVLSFFIMFFYYLILIKNKFPNSGLIFGLINSYMLIIMFLIIVDNLIR